MERVLRARRGVRSVPTKKDHLTLIADSAKPIGKVSRRSKNTSAGQAALGIDIPFIILCYSSTWGFLSANKMCYKYRTLSGP